MRRARQCGKLRSQSGPISAAARAAKLMAWAGVWTWLACALPVSAATPPAPVTPQPSAAPATSAPRNDEVTRILHEAEQAYQQANYLKAGRLLQQAANIVADLQTSQLNNLFPAALEGWQEVEMDNESPQSLGQVLQLFGGGGIVKRYQSVAKPEQAIQMALMNNPPRMLNMLLDAVQLASLGQLKKDEVSIDKYTTTLNCSDSRGCYILLPMDNHMILLVHGTATQGDLVLDYARRFRFAGLAEQ